MFYRSFTLGTRRVSGADMALRGTMRIFSALAIAIVACLGIRSLVMAQATDLFISEYVEGSSLNKAIEIYNGTGSAIDLTAGGYELQFFFNGSVSAGATIALNGTVADGDVFVVADDGADAAILAETDQTSTSNFFNGDDTVVLYKSGVIVDVIGQLGFDPGSQWGSGTTSTQDNTIRRKVDICQGDTNETDAFDPSIEWDGFANNTFDGLGSHTSNCNGSGTSGQPFPLTQGFDSANEDCGVAEGWEVVSVDSDTANTWSCSASFSNADVNGFGDSAAADEWLITPALNMDAQTNETLEFRTYTRFMDINYPQLEVLYSSDYDGSGNPAAATWTALSGITFSPEDSSQWTDSGTIDLSAITGDSVYFAFHYTSSGTGGGSAATWRLDEIDFGNGSGTSGQPFPLTQGFDSSNEDCGVAEGWEVVSVDADTANTWSCSASFSNADVNGFGNSAAADEWLITPALNMDAQTDETLEFRTYTRFMDINYPQLEVLYSSDYDGSGNPAAATWTALSGITFSPEDSSQWTDSGTIDLSAITGDSVYFAFHYTSSGTGGGSAATWRLDKIDFGTGGGTGEPTAAKIHEVQGAGTTIALNEQVTVNAIVVADFQSSEQLRGFFIQEEDADADTDPNTSEGIFVYCNSCPTDVAVGDLVEVTGLAVDFFAMSQIDVTVAGGNVTVSSSGNVLPTPASIDLPASGSTEAEATFENVEGMLVQFVDELYVSEYFELARYGQLVLTADAVPYQFTDVSEPSVAGYAAFLDSLNAKRIILDDDNNIQNDPITGAADEPYFWPRPGLSTGNFVRGGDSISNLTGVLHWSFAGQNGTDAWRVRPVDEAFSYDFSSNNARTSAPDSVGGSFKVASFNVLNYFTTINSRGADSVAELDRQREKIAAAICAIDADVVGLIEIENNGTTAINDLLDGTNGVNANCGPYTAINTGAFGTDQIAVAFIYKAATATPVGSHAILDSSVDLRFIDTKNRPALAQTFEETATGGALTVVVNHLKSKGSDCDDVGDPGLNDGAANCNLTRADAASAMVDWLATDPTASGDPDFLIIGDLNAYRMEDPIDNIELGSDDTAGTADDYTDLLDSLIGSSAYSYVFDGQRGYLDYALAIENLLPQVTGVTSWNINADEIPVFDYNDEILDGSNEQSFERESAALPIYESNAFRASDHDPIIVGLNLEAPVAAFASCGGFDVFVDETGQYSAPDFAGTLFVGTNRSDHINGTNGDDLILGLNGNDKINGKKGNDIICGGNGHDWLHGHQGNDIIEGGSGWDDIIGHHGVDELSGGEGFDIVLGGRNNDQILGESGPDLLFGQQGDDALDGGNGYDLCFGNSGADTIANCEGLSAADADESDIADADDDGELSAEMLELLKRNDVDSEIFLPFVQ